MFTMLRTKFGIPGIVSVIALVFAMIGGAYAANGEGGGKATSSAKAKKGPRGPRGPVGPAGPAGPAGPQGPKGDKGDKGDAGQQGNEGPEGKEGPKGDPWTAGGTLPSGETEKGSWSVGFNSAGGGIADISFTIPLSAELAAANVHVAPDASCTGTAANPTAAKGHLCVYANAFFSGNAVTPTIAKSGGPGLDVGASESGAVLLFQGTEENNENDLGFGSWAVTAP